MKRIIAIILAAAVAFCGCGLKKQLTAFGLYSKSVSDIAKAGGMEAECDIKIDLGVISTEFTVHLKQNGENSETVMYMGGEQVSRTVVFDGVSYVSSGGEKVKSPAEPLSENVSSAVPKLAEELFDGVEISETAEGSSVTVDIDSEIFADMLGEINGASPALDFDNAVLTMNYDKDDMITGMDLSADVEMSFSGVSMSAKMTADYDFINLGEAPEISPPDDANEYIEAQ